VSARPLCLAQLARASGLVPVLALSLIIAPGEASLARAEATGYAVGSGDVLAVEVRAGGEKQDEFVVTVTPAGSIACPLVGDVAVAGLSAPDIAERLAGALGHGYYVEPHVLVSVREYAGRVRVVGEVQHPGVFPMSAQLTVLGACDLAGGLTDFASARHVKLSRVEHGRPRLRTLDLVLMRQGKVEDVALQSGDRLEIPRRWF
jgi:polysaccharide export outer membrane protein